MKNRFRKNVCQTRASLRAFITIDRRTTISKIMFKESLAWRSLGEDRSPSSRHSHFYDSCIN